jgi:hypothetical protein
VVKGLDSHAVSRMVNGSVTEGAVVIFKTLNDYSAFIMKNPDHPAHEAVRNRLLKERREIDARFLRAPTGHEAKQGRPAEYVEVRATI